MICNDRRPIETETLYIYWMDIVLPAHVIQHADGVPRLVTPSLRSSYILLYNDKKTALCTLIFLSTF